MKKTLILALLVVGGAAFSTANAQSKKKEKKNRQQTEAAGNTASQKIELKTPADSLSYAAGMSMTAGLDGYLAKRVGLTKEQMPDFLRGLKYGIEHRKDADFAAYAAGMEVATQVEKSMLPSVESQFEGSSEKIDAEMLYRGFLAALEKDTALDRK